MRDTLPWAAERLGVDPEILPATELGTNQIRQRTDSHLQAGAIRHHLGNHPANCGVLSSRFIGRQFRQRYVVLDDGLNL
jgi:hypothetical protein